MPCTWIYGSLILSEPIVRQNLKPLAVGPDETVFDEPWQAQVLAMADLLIQSNQLSAGDWSSVLGKQLESTQDVAAGLNDAKENYYHAALSALMLLVDSNRIITSEQLKCREDDWKKAYLSTPHGKPVVLKK